MDLVANPYAVPGLVVLVVAWAMAALVYGARPGRPQNRRLAIVLAVEGAGIGAGIGLLYLMGDYGSAYGAQAVRAVQWAAIAPLYLLLIATLDTPLTRPFRGRVAETVFLAWVAAGAVHVLAWTHVHVSGLAPVWYAPWECVCGPATTYLALANGAVFFFGLVAAVAAWRRAPPGSAARSQARAFAVAFGVRDVVLGALYVSAFATYGFANWGTNPRWDVVWIFGQAAAYVVFVALLAYGILKTNLFDIDLRLKWTIRGGTVAAIFVAVFFVASELVKAFFEERAGLLIGVLAAAALVFALSPLQRFAERVADRALPDATGSPEYVAFRKLQVYRAAFEEAATGGVSRKERAMLDRLASELGVRPEDARAVEADVRGRAPPQ
ncbi:MAG: hypothetical protein ACT4PT_10895 [Methanobacteriota archaeon]